MLYITLDEVLVRSRLCQCNWCPIWLTHFQPSEKWLKWKIRLPSSLGIAQRNPNAIEKHADFKFNPFAHLHSKEDWCGDNRNLLVKVLIPIRIFLHQPSVELMLAVQSQDEFSIENAWWNYNHKERIVCLCSWAFHTKNEHLHENLTH